VASFTLQLLYPWGKSPWNPFDRRLGGPQRWSRVKKRNNPSLCPESNLQSFSLYHNYYTG